MTPPALRLILVSAAAGALLAAGTAAAQEAIRTAPEGAPPAGETAPAAAHSPLPPDEDSPDAIGRWARGVLAGEPAAEPMPKAPRGCVPAEDRRPHGQVWAGVGTGGYREVGGVVTQPLGTCGSVTIGAGKVESDGFRRR
jgi:hypothetical protein